MKDAWVRAAAAQTANGSRPDTVRRMPTWLADAQTSGFFKSQLNGPNRARWRPDMSCPITTSILPRRTASSLRIESISLGYARTFLESTGIPGALYMGREQW